MFNRWDNHNELNEGFIKPLKSVGTVLLNGRMAKGLVASACASKSPYYEKPIGIYVDHMATVSRGDIIFTLYNKNNTLDIINSDPNQSLQSSIAVNGISALNGHGHNQTNGNIILQHSAHILGIAEMSNDVNKRDVYNVLIGGVHTVRNNGNEVIRTNDKVMAYFPTMDEFKSNKNGKTTDAEFKGGIVKPWFKPYKIKTHKNQLKQIYDCLVDNEKSNY